MSSIKKLGFITAALTIALMLTSCDTQVSGYYTIGGTGPSGVGTVFYVTGDGLHGFEVAPANWNGAADDPTYAWSDVTDAEATTETKLGSGFDNSEAIIIQAGSTDIAAQRCRDYRSDKEGDWFLPSRGELSMLFLQVERGALEGFDSAGYWSSSEVDASNAYSQNFTDGTQGTTGKGTPLSVRPIRTF
jgi:hypothetical protein